MAAAGDMQAREKHGRDHRQPERPLRRTWRGGIGEYPYGAVGDDDADAAALCQRSPRCADDERQLEGDHDASEPSEDVRAECVRRVVIRMRIAREFKGSELLNAFNNSDPLNSDRIQSVILPTNLRWTPNLDVTMSNGRKNPFDQLEFNFIQAVVYPLRLFRK